MRYANMMWRFSNFVFCFLVFVISANAQREPDSLFYIKFASPLDFLLQPAIEMPDYMNYAHDSMSFVQHGAGKTLTVSVKETDYKGKKPAVMKEYYSYHFNGDGQTSAVENRDADSILQSVTDYVYLRTGQIAMVIKKRMRYQSKDSIVYVTDTTSSAYDRSGLLSSWCEKSECIQRLYNSQKQLIVKRNALYGYIRGDYTYEYDSEGRLVQRRFLDARSGIILFTDTVQYSFVNVENTILAQKHYIRLSGKAEWVLFDEILLETANHRAIKYTLFYPAIRSNRGLYTPGSISYTYDDGGKLLAKHYDDKNGIMDKTYSRHAVSDTLRTYKIVPDKKSMRKILWSETIIVYDSNGLIASVKSIDYKLEKQRSKSNAGIAMIREEEYHWN